MVGWCGEDALDPKTHLSVETPSHLLLPPRHNRFTSSPLVPALRWAAWQGVPCAMAVLEMLQKMLFSQPLPGPARLLRGVWH